MDQQQKAERDLLTETGLNIARDAGIDALRIDTSSSVEKKLVMENREFSLAQEMENRSVGVKVLKDQRSGSCSTNIFTADAVRDCIRSAAELASWSIPDEHLNFAGTDQAPPARPLARLRDENLTALGYEELEEAMAAVVGVLTEDKRVCLDRFEMSVEETILTMANSHGVRQQESQTTVQWDYLAMAADGDEVSGMDYTNDFSFHREDFRQKALDGAAVFRERIVRSLHPEKCPAYKGPVLLSPRVVDELLLNNLLYHVSGRQIMDGKSRWADKLGEAVVSPGLTLWDQPHDTKLMGCTAWDSDGIPTAPFSIIEEGVLTGQFFDCYSGRKTGNKPNGMAGGPFGLTVSPGKDTLEDMAGAAPVLLLVDSFSGNADPLTGDFSGVAKSSRLYRDGKDSAPVGETMIAGNVFDLASRIRGVSQESAVIYGVYSSPWMLVEGMSVS